MANSIVASGYKDLLDTPFGKGVVFAGQIITKNFEDDMLFHITNTSVADKLIRAGQVVQFSKPARVGAWRPYELNQRLVSDQPTSDSFCITLCNTAYKSIKVDELTIYRAEEEWTNFERSFLEDTWRNLSDLWHNDVLTGMQLQVSSRNFGKHAGRYGVLDLGTVGNPLQLNPDTVISLFHRLGSVLQSAGRWYDGEMFILVPPAMKALLLETVYAKQFCCSPRDGVIFKGLQAEDILGFTVIETDRLTPVVDEATKRLVYPILAGWNEAYCFSGDIVSARLREMDGAFGIVYELLAVYGGGVIYPEALAKAYVSFSTEGTVLN